MDLSYEEQQDSENKYLQVISPSKFKEPGDAEQKNNEPRYMYVYCKDCN